MISRERRMQWEVKNVIEVLKVDQAWLLETQTFYYALIRNGTQIGVKDV